MAWVIRVRWTPGWARRCWAWWRSRCSATLAIQASASRVMFSMARDNRLPFGKFRQRSTSAPGTPVITPGPPGQPAGHRRAAGEPGAGQRVRAHRLGVIGHRVLWPTHSGDGAADPPACAGTGLSHGKPVMDLGRWGIPVNLIAAVMGTLLVINIGWPRAEVYNPPGTRGCCSTSR